MKPATLKPKLRVSTVEGFRIIRPDEAKPGTRVWYSPMVGRKPLFEAKLVGDGNLPCTYALELGEDYLAWRRGGVRVQRCIASWAVLVKTRPAP